MYILQRYIIRQHIGPFLFGFSVITLLWILNLLFTRLGHLLSRGLSFGVILEFFFLNMAWIIALTLPMAVLMACLMAFGRMSSDLEITAIKASGINFYRIIFPVFLIATLLCLFLIWFNNSVLPESNHRLALLARDIQRKRPTLTLEPGIIYREIPNIHLMVKSVQELENLSYIKGVLIYDQSDPNVKKITAAQRGEIFVDERNGLLRVTLYNGEMHETPIDKLQTYRRLKFPKQVMTIAIPDMALQRSESEYRSDREQSSQMMLSEISKNKQLINKQNVELNDYLLSQIQRYIPPITAHPVGDRFEKNAPIKTTITIQRNSLEKQIRIHKSLLQRIKSTISVNQNYSVVNSKLLVEVHKKYSIPFACIVFVLVGAPLGVMARKGSMAIGGGISLVFFLIYWSFLIAGEELADRQLLSPFIAMWLANILVGGLGVYLVIHTVKELTIIRFEELKLLIPRRFRRYAHSG